MPNHIVFCGLVANVLCKLTQFKFGRMSSLLFLPSFPVYYLVYYLLSKCLKASHLSPQEGADAQEDAPQPLVDGQTHTAEGFTTKLHNDDLQEERQTTSCS